MAAGAAFGSCQARSATKYDMASPKISQESIKHQEKSYRNISHVVLQSADLML
jgi:hypothetical protein